MSYNKLQHSIRDQDVEKKYLTIHSDDIDLSKFPNSNDFEIPFPVEIKNIISMKLNSISLPSTYATFSDKYENTKLSFTIKPSKYNEFRYKLPRPYGTTPYDDHAWRLLNMIYEQGSPYNNFVITIKEGSYTPIQLANEIQYLMNNDVQQWLINHWNQATSPWWKATLVQPNIGGDYPYNVADKPAGPYYTYYPATGTQSDSDRSLIYNNVFECSSIIVGVASTIVTINSPDITPLTDGSGVFFAPLPGSDTNLGPFDISNISNDGTDTSFNLFITNSATDITTINTPNFATYAASNRTKKMFDSVKTMYLSGIEPYNYFKVHYDSVTMKYYIGNIRDDFTLNFDDNNLGIFAYNNSKCYQTKIWSQYNKWGLPSYLGFNKQIYTTLKYEPNHPQYDNSGIYFSNNDIYWLQPILDASGIAHRAYKAKSYYINSDNPSDIFGESDIYLSIDKYNNMDEITPFNCAWSNINNNMQTRYNGITNNAFAKISIDGTVKHNDHNGICNDYKTRSETILDPPLQTIKKLKFKFRYHDGRLVDFGSRAFNFVIEFNCLKNSYNRV